MARIRVCLSLILAFLVASPSLPFLIKGDIDFHLWCQRTAHPDVCTSVIQNDPRSNLKTSLGGLLTILSDKARSTIAACSSQVVTLLKSPGSTPQLKDGLKKCWIAYKRANQTLDKQNYGAINNETYHSLNCNLGRVYDQAVLCETAFQDPTKPPFTPQDTDIMNVAKCGAQLLNINRCNQSDACQNLPGNQKSCF